MRKELLELCPTFDKKKPIDSEEYFSENYIAPCFWVPRKAEYGGKPWLDDALFIFAHSRAFDYKSAAKRFFKFNAVAYSTGIVSLDEIPPDVLHTCITMAGYTMSPTLDAHGRPVVYMTCGYYDWNKMTILGAQRAHVWLFWQWCLLWGDAALTKGISFVMCFKGVNDSQRNLTFHRWCCEVFFDCLPTKIAAMYVSHQPFWFGNIVWPVLKMSLKAKMLARVHWLGTKDKHASAKYLTEAFKIDDDSDESYITKVRLSIPVELGGSLQITPETTETYFRGNWQLSDEDVPEGTMPEGSSLPTTQAASSKISRLD